MTARRWLPVAIAALTACRNDAGQVAPAPPSPAPASPAAGRVITERFHSDALGVDKQVRIYLPAGYEAARRYPVFYYLHGLGGDETDWVDGGKLDQVADRLGLQAIVVMPDGDNGFYIDSAKPVDLDACLRRGAGLFIPSQPRRQTCTRTSSYETYIVHDLIDWVDHHYATIASRDGRAIAGLSMGGYGALMLAMRHPDVFAAAASHSGVDALLYAGPFPYARGEVRLLDDPAQWGRAIGPFGAWVRALYGSELATWRAHDPAYLATQLAPGQLRLYLDGGTEDEFRLHDGMQYLHDVLRERGIAHAYYLGPGHHDFRFWAARLPSSLAFLRDAIAKPR